MVAAIDARVDVAVIGAGVIGLAIGRSLARSGREVVILEAEAATGMHTSSRNSEVIHSGIYYRTDSLKARLCVSGREMLYDYCRANDIAFARPGKIVVAARAHEIAVLEGIKAQAEKNGVHDLIWLDEGEVRALEPEVRSVRGLHCPSTGILDSHEFMTALRRDAEAAGARVVLAAPVLSGHVGGDGVVLDVGGADPVSVQCRAVVNSAGLRAQDVARSIAGIPRSTIPASFLAKGHYFTLAGSAPFRHLVYPVPAPGGLGIHSTLDLAGQVRFGPDVSWVDAIDYSFDETRAASFYEAIRAYYPALEADRLVPGYTGIRPKLGPSGSPMQDFVIHGPRELGVPGMVNLFGIESPGLTASLAVAEHVRKILAPVG